MVGSMGFEDQELLQEFVIESSEHLADIENQLLSIEAAGKNLDVDLVNTVFRGVHSIKGAAGFLGLTSINKLAHSLENVLNLMRERTLTPTSGIVEVMLKAGDQLRTLVQNVNSSNETDVSDLSRSLDAIAAGESPACDVPVSDPVAEVSVPAPVMAAPVIPAQVHATPVVPAPAPAVPTPTPAAAKPVAAEKAAKNAENGEGNSNKTSDSNIRVSVEVLDQLMNLAGELVLGRNQLLQTLSSSDRANLEAVAARINQVTSEMQDAIMQTRMQPIGNVFSRFTRVVRDLSNKLGKQCQLVIEGKDVEVDKTIIEAIGDPLTHLVRNAIDHGLEMPDHRIANGKAPCGTLLLRASHQSGKVRIEIQDDGKGLDASKIKAKALEKGLITVDQAKEMSDREASKLIFLPGFSTAETVSDVSGRGVGMDVVRTNIEKLGGAVEIESVVGKGTTIHVNLPLTLAIIPSLIVQCGKNRFAIPQVNIVELVRIRSNETTQRINRVQGAEVLRLRGTLLPIVRLRSALGIESEPEDLSRTAHAMNIIVVETGQLRYGIVVDGLSDSEEIVVKPLGRHLTKSRCLNGATILGDGRVALILDVAGISAHIQLRSVSESESGDMNRSSDSSKHVEETQRLLLFTNHPDEMFAAPMGLVARIERIAASDLLSIGGRLVLQYRGTTLPLVTLEQVIQAKPRPELDRLFVVVFSVGNREIGLIAPQLEDIRNLTIDPDVGTLREPGVVGSFIFNDRTVRLLDLFTVTQRTYPDLVQMRQAVVAPRVDLPSNNSSASTTDTTVTESKPAAASAQPRLPTLLLAEDSNFFRKQVKNYFEEAGYRAVDFPDGLAAWNALKSGKHQIDLVVTDVEMPNMNGLQLCKAIKSDPNFAKLPVIALTSLAGDEDVRQGKAVGVDDYQVKMDRERLLESVHRLLMVEA